MLLKMNVIFYSDEYYSDQIKDELENMCNTCGNEKCTPNFHINRV